MLSIKSTKQLTGIEIKGDYEDLDLLYDALSNVIGAEDCYPAYEASTLRILGLCYEIRHAYQGDRMTSKSTDGSNYYSFNWYWPEMVFIAAVLGDYVDLTTSRKSYLNDENVRFFREETRQRLKEELPNHIAYIRYFQSLIWNELKHTIGQKRFKKVFGTDGTRIYFNIFEQSFYNYCTQMIDILNVKYLKWKPERRESYLATVTERILKISSDYIILENSIKKYAKEEGVSYHEIELEGMEYPETIEW